MIPQTELGVLTSFLRSKSGWNPRIVEPHKNQCFFNKNDKKVRTSLLILKCKSAYPHFFHTSAVILTSIFWRIPFFHTSAAILVLFLDAFLSFFRKHYKTHWNLMKIDTISFFICFSVILATFLLKNADV